MMRIVAAAVVLGVASAPGLAIAAHPRTLSGSEPHLVAISDIVVPVIDGNRVNGRLSFDIVVDAADAQSASRIRTNDARMRSVAIVAGLEFSRLYVSGLRPVNVELLAQTLTHELRSHEPRIDRILIVKVAASQG